MTLSVLLVGFGYGAKTIHIPLVSSTPGLNLYGIFARSKQNQDEARSSFPSVRVFGDIDEALSDPEVSLVVIATPHSSHCELAVKALNAGKNVIVDKPMCLTLEEADQMISAAKLNDRMLSVFHNRRWDGDFLTLRKILAEGSLGTVKWAEFSYQRFGLSSKAWKMDSIENGGGCFLDLGAHMVDQALQVFSPHKVVRVFARIQKDFEGLDVDTFSLLVLEFSDGSTATIDASARNLIPKPRYYICGSSGTFVKHGVDPQEDALKNGNIDNAVEPQELYGTLKCIVPGDGKPREVESRVPTERGSWRKFYENVHAHLTNGEDLMVKPHEVRRVIQVLLAGLESVKTHSIVVCEI